MSSSALVAGQHVREQDAVVVAVRLVAEHGDRELLAAAAREDLLDRAGARHAVADDHEPALRVGVAASADAVDLRRRRGGHQTSTMPRSTITEPVSPAGAARCSSTAVPPSRSSTTRSGTCTSPLAPIGK